MILKDAGLKPGSEVHLKTYLGPTLVSWVACHSEYTAGKKFCDIQIRGPFAKWVHYHRTIPKNEDQLYGGLGNGIAGRSIEQLFHYRHTLLRHDIEVQNSFPTPPLTIVITGASGLVERELSAFLRSAGHRVLSLVRREPKENEIIWDINSGKIEAEKFEEIDGVIHLAGENIGSGRWTNEKKRELKAVEFVPQPSWLKP